MSLPIRSSWRRSTSALAVLLIFSTSALTGDDADMASSVRALEIVPCLLPARIRKLGGMTYPERRKLVESTARECELRGGEYTFYDRANPANAAEFFLKTAEGGDLEAQVNLGDVYQYLFTPAKYVEAAQWYRSAAEAGNKKGAMQLARLYERGLGVETDGLMAVNLWREATGAGEELVLASKLTEMQTEAEARIAQLTGQLRERSEQTEAARRELVDARALVSTRRSELSKAQAQLAALRKQSQIVQNTASDPLEAQKLRRQITQQERTIDDQRFEIESLQSSMSLQEGQLAANLKQVELQNTRLEKELSRVSSAADAQLSAALAELETKDAEILTISRQLQEHRGLVQDRDGAYSQLLAELEQTRVEAASSKRAKRKVATLEERQKTQLAELEAGRLLLASAESELAATSREAELLRGQLDSQVRATSKAEAQYSQIEAKLQASREQVSSLNAKLETADAQLAQLTREREELKTRMAAAETNPPAILALQSQLQSKEGLIAGQRADIDQLRSDLTIYAAELEEIMLRRKSYATRSPMEDTSKVRMPRNVKIGKYYALVIGNDNYEYLTDLENAKNDARAVHKILQDDYGFTSELVLDATQRDMFEATAGLIQQTEENDLVLIYYAGHGYRVQDQSYWLPVDIRSKREAAGLGLSSDTVANWIKKIPAKHVMIIADSCYSGAGIETTGGFSYTAQQLEEMLPFLMKSRSRTMLTSGGDGPVFDGGGEEHSVFTKELLGLLEENKGVLHGEAMYTYLLERVKYSVDGVEVNQTPTFGSIERAGHESGQFVFVHRQLRI